MAQDAPPDNTTEADTTDESEDDAPVQEDQEKTKEHGSRLSFLKELPALLVIALILALLIKTFLIQAFYIPSESMEPTLRNGDRVLVNKVVYHLHAVRRGDVIVFADPHPLPVHRSVVGAFWHWLTSGLGGGSSSDKDFIKRVIGLPDDLVEVRSGVVYVNGQPLTEPYLNRPLDRSGFVPHRVPADTLFVMGDNRGHSADSRTLLGYIPMDKVIGRAFVLIWPPSRIGILHRPNYPDVPSAFPSLGLTSLILMRRRRPALLPPDDASTGCSPRWTRPRSGLRPAAEAGAPRSR